MEDLQPRSRGKLLSAYLTYARELVLPIGMGVMMVPNIGKLVVYRIWKRTRTMERGGTTMCLRKPHAELHDGAYRVWKWGPPTPYMTGS